VGTTKYFATSVLMVIRDMNGPLDVIVEVLRIHDHGSQKLETTK
jgi:hypothetical protein